MRNRLCACLLFVLILSAGPSWAQATAPWQPWTWPKKMQLGPVSFYAAQRVSLIDDEKANSTYVRNYDLLLFTDWKMSEKDQLRVYALNNPVHKSHPQVKSPWWLIYAYYERDLGSGLLRVGKVPFPFNYQNGFPEWHSQVRRVTRVWDYGMTWSSKPRDGWQWDIGWVTDGTTTSSDITRMNEPALVGRIRAGVGERLEAGVSGMYAPKRTIAGTEADLSRFGAHLRWLPSSRLELRGEYVDFRTLSQGSVIRPAFAGKNGHGWVAEGLYQFSGRLQAFVNYNSLNRAGSGTAVHTWTLGGRVKVHDRLYLIPEVWLVDDDLPKTDALYDDNRYMLTALALF
ncbi:MAG TPA: hypothetical protein GX715_07760 [Armatimonadetes bacterium]|jgi:hypothetical protein|nr:hypothetical protein [Armatimonadota bacterium]